MEQGRRRPLLCSLLWIQASSRSGELARSVATLSLVTAPLASHSGSAAPGEAGRGSVRVAAARLLAAEYGGLLRRPAPGGRGGGAAPARRGAAGGAAVLGRVVLLWQRPRPGAAGAPAARAPGARRPGRGVRDAGLPRARLLGGARPGARRLLCRPARCGPIARRVGAAAPTLLPLASSGLMQLVRQN